MATNLTSQKIKDTFSQVLHIDGGRQMWGEDWPGGIPDHFRRDAGR